MLPVISLKRRGGREGYTRVVAKIYKESITIARFSRLAGSQRFWPGVSIIDAEPILVGEGIDSQDSRTCQSPRTVGGAAVLRWGWGRSLVPCVGWVGAIGSYGLCRGYVLCLIV